jgi:hypothetical protein
MELGVTCDECCDNDHKEIKVLCSDLLGGDGHRSCVIESAGQRLQSVLAVTAIIRLGFGFAVIVDRHFGDHTSQREFGQAMSWLKPNLGHWSRMGNRRKLPDSLDVSTCRGNSSMTFNPLTGDLNGTAGLRTTIRINDSIGGAVFLHVHYAGVQITSNAASATFTIKAGSNLLSFVYEAPVPGDNLTLTDAGGALLDSFPNDPSNPIRQCVVSA